MHSVNCVSDARSGPSLQREEVAKSDWISSISVSENPRLRSGTNQNVDVVRTILLHVRMEETCVLVLLGIVKNLAVPALLGTHFIDEFVEVINPAERNIVTYSSQAMPILMAHETSNYIWRTKRTADVSDSSILTLESYKKRHVLRVARATAPDPISETPVLVNISTRGTV